MREERGTPERPEHGIPTRERRDEQAVTDRLKAELHTGVLLRAASANPLLHSARRGPLTTFAEPGTNNIRSSSGRGECATAYHPVFLILEHDTRKGLR